MATYLSKDLVVDEEKFNTAAQDMRALKERTNKLKEKLSTMYEELGNKEAALKAYNTIQDNYPQSPEGYEIGKYISRLQINK